MWGELWELAGAWWVVGQIAAEEFELLKWQQLVAALTWQAKIWRLNHVGLRCRENHISDSILTSWEEDHGNAGTALRRNYCRLAGLEAFASGKQNKELFSAAQ